MGKDKEEMPTEVDIILNQQNNHHKAEQSLQKLLWGFPFCETLLQLSWPSPSWAAQCPPSAGSPYHSAFVPLPDQERGAQNSGLSSRNLTAGTNLIQE